MTPNTKKNPEIPKNFDPVFNHEGLLKSQKRVLDLPDRKRAEFSEYEIRFSIAFSVVEIFCNKVTLIFSEFIPIFQDIW